MKRKKYVTYVKKCFVTIKTKKQSESCHNTGKFRGAAHSESNCRYKVPKGIPVVFHNSSTYDCYFVIKKLAEKVEEKFEYLGEHTEKYTTFSVPLKKEMIMVKDHIQIKVY